MARTPSQKISRRSSSAGTASDPKPKQEELFSNGSSWRSKFTANAYGSRSELLPRKPIPQDSQIVTSAPPPSEDLEKAE